ncbi:putative methyltransferase DDB_G0268948 [Procambarus clarkii]|uniref:putative methyltransferase DDB_G0268948 n=1 Tax=Procambarus clarkii TaxID=6728 RepID=UPI0037437675
MADMTFSDPEIVKHYVRCRPAPPHSLINTVINFLKEKMKTPLEVCVDAGCGSGQNTELYSRHFTRVLGVDVSDAQIAAARSNSQHHNVSYRVGLAEQLPVESASVDLVTCCISVHWFDLDAFYSEVRRVLRPGGVLACYSYHIFSPIYRGKNLSQTFEQFLESIQQYWPKGIVHLKSNLATLPVFSDEEVSYGEGKFTVEREVTFADTLEYVESMSLLKNFLEAEGKDSVTKLISNLKQVLATEMGSTDEAAPLTQVFDYGLRMWRTPSV